MDINVTVWNQRLRVAPELLTIVSGTQKFVRFVFHLDSSWTGITNKICQFVQKKNMICINQTLSTTTINGETVYTCYLPSEITPGSFTILVYASSGTPFNTSDTNQTIAVTESTKFNVINNSITSISDLEEEEIDVDPAN